MNKNNNPSKINPQETAHQVARSIYGVTDERSRRRVIRSLLAGAVLCALLIPLLFYVNFNEIGPIGWGLTVSLVAFCLLSVVGLVFLNQTEFHSPVPLRGDLSDRIGAFWLAACFFGPLLGWVITAVFPITLASWRWLYGLRLACAAGLPILTALPMVRYLRGRSIWVGLPLLVIVTALPVLSVLNVGWDFWQGPVQHAAELGGQVQALLVHTGIILK